MNSIYLTKTSFSNAIRICPADQEWSVRMFTRGCKLPKTNGFFLFGARGTGKTSLLRAYWIPCTELLNPMNLRHRNSR